MAARKSGLGRGLDALIPQDRPTEGYGLIPVGAVDPNPNQPRTDFDQTSIDELAESIEAVGLLQPIVVRTAGDGYVLVAGERRLRAVKQLGWDDVAAVIRDETDDATNLTEALVENLQREDLSPLEEAAAYQELLEEYGMTHDGVASSVGKSRSTITNSIRLLQLPQEIQQLLASGVLTAGHARPLVGAEDEAYAIHIARRASAEGWSVRRVEEAMRLRATQAQAGRARSAAVRPAAIIELEERLRDRLDTKVTIDHRGTGGKITIRYGSPDDLERIYRHLFEPEG
ncbi:MAG: ParB/RepB/Spo0J family partition protein [Acidimicrobiia bacterium]|nr:ParB/RepB/Spo0J family partition protein [Acidimicrobiia bacterium]